MSKSNLIKTNLEENQHDYMVNSLRTKIHYHYTKNYKNGIIVKLIGQN